MKKLVLAVVLATALAAGLAAMSSAKGAGAPDAVAAAAAAGMGSIAIDSAVPISSASYAADQGTAGATVTPAAVTPTSNLLDNPDAEAGPGGNGIVVLAAPGWAKWRDVSCMGPTKTTVVKYGAPGGFPTHATPGPADRGKNFFAGGPWTCSHSGLLQWVDLTPHSGAIAHGAEFQLGGWFGGFKTDRDTAGILVGFYDLDGNFLGVWGTGFPTKGNRNNKTRLLWSMTQDWVPHIPSAAAAWALVVVENNWFDGGYTDGYSDSLAFNLLVHTYP